MLVFSDQIILRSLYARFKSVCVEEGYTVDEDTYTDDETQRYFDDLKAIKQSKGFHIDLFSESSARNKRMKDSVRVVMFLSRVYDGEIGAPPAVILKNDAGAAKDYRQGLLPGKASNLIFAIHLIGSTSRQNFVLNAITANALGQRNFIPIYDAPTADPFLIYNSSFIDLDDPLENLFEKAYYYTVPDVYLGQEIKVRDINSIKEINVAVKDVNGNDLTTIKAP